jgi:hypothetical protein
MIDFIAGDKVMTGMSFHGQMARSLSVVMVASMLMLTIVVGLMATPAQASYATYEKGDKFAMKGEKDIKMSFTSMNQMVVLGDQESWLRDAVIENADLQAYVGSAAVFEIIEVTADEYVMRIDAAQNISISAVVEATGEMVPPGSYIYSWSSMSKNPDGLLNLSEATGTLQPMGLDANMVMGVNETFTVHLQKSDLAIRSVQGSMDAYMRGHVDISNYPNNSVDYDLANARDVINITSYDSFSSNISMDLAANGSMSFQPALGIIKDSPAEGSTWKARSFVNASFVWSGVLNATGLPQNITDALFDAEAESWGVTGFPIDLAKIYNPDSSGPQIDNGTLSINNVEVEFEFSNLGNLDLVDPIYGNITAYRQGFDNASDDNNFELWYYPAEGAFVGAKLKVPFIGSSTIVVSMASANVEEARSTTDAIADQVANRMTYDEVNAPAPQGFFDDPMNILLVIGLIAIAGIAVAGFVLWKKKHKT